MHAIYGILISLRHIFIHEKRKNYAHRNNYKVTFDLR